MRPENCCFLMGQWVQLVLLCLVALQLDNGHENSKLATRCGRGGNGSVVLGGAIYLSKGGLFINSQ